MNEPRLLAADDAAEYDRFLAESPEATVYHTRAWHELLCRIFDYEPRVVVAMEAGAIVGALPLALVSSLTGGRRLVSLPFSHEVVPLARSTEVRAALVDAALRQSLADGCRYVELRSGSSGGAGWTRDESYVVTRLTIDRDDDVQMRRLTNSTRGQLLQGLRNSALVIEEGADPKALREFGSLMAATRRRKGSLTYPATFYRELARLFVEPGLACLERAMLDGRCVAVQLTFSFGSNALYGYSAITDEVSALRARPMNVLMWRAIQWARRQGAQLLDLGISLRSQTGLIHFKEGWGGATQPLPYQVRTNGGHRGRGITQDGPVARLASAVLRRVPQSLFTRLTPHLLRQVG